MATPLVSDELWTVVEPMLPKRRVRRGKGGRPPVPDRDAFAGIVFVLKTGIAWEDLPREMGCGSGMSCWRRLRDWHRAGVFKRLHRRLLGELRKSGRLDWSRALVDSASVRAMHGGKKRETAPWTAGKRGRSTTCSRTPTGRRWRRRSPAPTGTT
jgi:transposase